MKTVQEILGFIDEYILAILEQPQAYFQNVDYMERELALLEALHEYIIVDSPQKIFVASKFGEFFQDEGYGTLGFSRGKVPNTSVINAPTPDEISQMNQLADLWRKYLSSGRRLQPQGR